MIDFKIEFLRFLVQKVSILNLLWRVFSKKIITYVSSEVLNIALFFKNIVNKQGLV